MVELKKQLKEIYDKDTLSSWMNVVVKRSNSFTEYVVNSALRRLNTVYKLELKKTKETERRNSRKDQKLITEKRLPPTFGPGEIINHTTCFFSKKRMKI